MQDFNLSSQKLEAGIFKVILIYIVNFRPVSRIHSKTLSQILQNKTKRKLPNISELKCSTPVPTQKQSYGWDIKTLEFQFPSVAGQLRCKKSPHTQRCRD